MSDNIFLTLYLVLHLYYVVVVLTGFEFSNSDSELSKYSLQTLP